jgi:1-acyl-sn-glycerol-3-phosphate acyltransferase
VPWHYSVAKFAVGAVLRPATGWQVWGREHVPRSGGLIVASNHISFWDPPLIGAILPREVHYLAKEELFSNPVFGAVIRSYNAIPIRRGMVDLSGMARAVETLRRGGAMMLFPEGTRMRDGKLHPARPGVGMMAVNAGVPIVPCYISGSNQPSRWLGRRERVRVSFGAPLTWQELAGPETDLTPGRALYQRVGDAVMREIARLRTEQMDKASRGAA